VSEDVQPYGDKIEGNLLVSEDLKINGVVAGNIVVASGASLHLCGMCAGNVVIEKGASASITGFVRGDVINRGTIEIYGMVQGNVRSKEGKVLFSADSVIGGAREV